MFSGAALPRRGNVCRSNIQLCREAVMTKQKLDKDKKQIRDTDGVVCKAFSSSPSSPTHASFTISPVSVLFSWLAAVLGSSLLFTIHSLLGPTTTRLLLVASVRIVRDASPTCLLPLVRSFCLLLLLAPVLPIVAQVVGDVRFAVVLAELALGLAGLVKLGTLNDRKES